MEIIESGIKFIGSDELCAVKFDGTPFYLDRYSKLEGGKGVDVIIDSDDALYLIEVKNCKETAENQDTWRRHFSGTRNMDTFATEIAQKTAHTCACLVGVSTFDKSIKVEDELLGIAKAIQSEKFSSGKKKLYVLLYLEGDFSCKSRPDTAIKRDIRKKIERKLHWLKCNVDVLDTSKHRLEVFKVSLI